jgi:hypothetical protein
VKKSSFILGVLCIGLLVSAGGAMAANDPEPPSSAISPDNPIRWIREIQLRPPLPSTEDMDDQPMPVGPPTGTLYPPRLAGEVTAKTGPSSGTGYSYGGALVAARGGSVYSQKQVADRQIDRLIRRLD